MGRARDLEQTELHGQQCQTQRKVLWSLKHLCFNSWHFFSSKQITISILPTLSKYLRVKQDYLCSAAMTKLCSGTWDALLTCLAGQFQVMLGVLALNNPLPPLSISHNNLLQLHSEAQQPSTTDSHHIKHWESCRACVGFTVCLC